MRKHAAFAATTCSSGPPCMPGKTARSTACACSSRHSTKPDRGPASVLCVVDVTMSQCSTGFGWSPAATRPEKWAMSHMRRAPTSSAIRRNSRRVDRPRVGRAAADDQLWPVHARELAHLVVVDHVRLARDAVVDERVEPAREVHLQPVGQVAAVVEPERQDRVARLQQGEVGGHVRLRAGVRLDVRVLGAEERLRPVDRQLLDLVDDLAAAVVALARITLGVLVRRHRADRLEHARPGEVLGRDQLDLVPLPLRLAPQQIGDLGVDVGQTGRAEAVQRVLGDGHSCSFRRDRLDARRGGRRAAARPRPGPHRRGARAARGR